uniref:Fas activated serine/threonine kinase n=1 Tax=Podarcis muralis TaxID=64176 RepID=A0A670KKT0_PODMU
CQICTSPPPFSPAGLGLLLPPTLPPAMLPRSSFVALKRLLERSRSVPELLRWLWQNPGRVSGAHYALALGHLGRLLPPGKGGPRLEPLLRQRCAHFDDATLVRCLQASAALGETWEWGGADLGMVEREGNPKGLLVQPPGSQCSPGSPCQGQPRKREAVPIFIQPALSLRRLVPWQGGGLTPPTMALVAKYLARHRLREPRLLDAIATFLLERAQQLDSKMIQKLVFPFSRLNFRPSNHAALFPRLEAALQKPGVSPLAALNVLMSLVQLGHFPPALLRQVFSPAFLANVTSSPCGQIVLRYLSLLDAAVALEVPEYRGPRLPPQYHVRMFEGALTADEANRKYSYKGLVGEALCQLVGRGCFRQDEVVPPGYCLGEWGAPSFGACGVGKGPPAGEGGSASAPRSLASFAVSDTPFPPPRVVLSVNDQWHYCHGSSVLVGSRAMRSRHLRLLGYRLVQVSRTLPPHTSGWAGPLPGSVSRLCCPEGSPWAGSGSQALWTPAWSLREQEQSTWSPRVPGSFARQAFPLLLCSAAALPGAGENEGRRGDQGLPETEAGGAAILKQTPRCGSVWVTGQRARLGMVWVFPCRAHIPPVHP